jgi:hypothetical protein
MGIANNGKKVDRKHIVLVVPRGEAVRNFLYSDTLRCLSENAWVTLLSVMDDEKFIADFRPFCKQIIPLKYYQRGRVVAYLQRLVDTAHDRWLWSEVAKNRWAIHDKAATGAARHRRLLLKGIARPLANRYSLEALTEIERQVGWMMRPNDAFLDLFEEIKPDLVFNCSHIHGPAGDLPLKAAHRMGIPTVGFIFSWDNLTSRSRIFVPYDYYCVWNEKMRDQLLSIYPSTSPDRVFVTGTPQFDFHFKPEFHLEREELCRRIGADPQRPLVLYTTGVDRHFPEEHRHVEVVARLLQDIDVSPKPQLVVRTYVKGTSPEMKALATKRLPGVVFPPVLWEKNWFTPLFEDLAIYTSLLRHTSIGINTASTVSLELLMHDKPVMNIGFDPPGSQLNPLLHFERHINFDHYRPVVESSATMVARSVDDMRDMLYRGLTQPGKDSAKRKRFIQQMFGSTLDGHSGERVAQQLLDLARSKRR